VSSAPQAGQGRLSSRSLDLRIISNRAPQLRHAYSYRGMVANGLRSAAVQHERLTSTQSPSRGHALRVAFFTESVLPLVDGVSMTLDRLFRALHAEGVEFRIYAPFVPGDEIAWAGRVRPVRYIRFPLYRDYRLSLPGGRGVAGDLATFAPDIVHVVSPTPMAAWAQSWARARGIPVVATFHTHFVSYFPYYNVGGLEWLGWRILRWFYGRCVATYAPSSTIVDELMAHGVPNVRLWSRGVDTRAFSPGWRDDALREQVGASDRRPLLLLVSRLVKEKDLADLVGVDRELSRRGIDYSLVLVGDGPMRRRLERDLPHAHFAGYQSGRTLARWYASGDVFIFPSTTETFANVVQEAMASGLPSVVVDRGGPQGVIEPGRSGFVARAHDIGDMADRLQQLLQDRELRRTMALSARRRALSRSWDVVTSRMIREYNRLANVPREQLQRLA
jgi:phosphatidylinositol alpha 1,6-mannosyltransferase